MSTSEIVLLTGGTGLLGEQLAQELRDCGHRVFFTSRSDVKIRELERRLNAGFPTNPIKGIRVDLLGKRFIDVLNKGIGSDLGPTVLINNARNIEYLKVKDGVTRRNEFIREFELGVLVPYEMCVRWGFRPRGRLRHVVNVASIYGIVAPNKALHETGYDNSPIQYGVVKAALAHLTKELAVRLAGHGIRVNAVSYGGVEGRASKEFIRRYSALTPMGRMLRQSEVGGPVRFLLSKDANGMTGHNLVCDGGFTIW